jgi:hypothetical protein
MESLRHVGVMVCHGCIDNGGCYETQADDGRLDGRRVVDEIGDEIDGKMKEMGR